jgi:hypothetical protein
MMSVVISRRIRARRLRVASGRPASIETYAIPLWPALQLCTALWLRRQAFRLIEWTRRLEASIYMRAEAL